MNNIIKEQEEKIRKEMELPDSAVEKIFDNLGFLDGLKNGESRYKVAKSMYAVYEFILSENRESCACDSVVFPIIRRILTDQEYDGHLLYGDELYSFMKENKVSDLRRFLENILSQPSYIRSRYKIIENKEHLSSLYYHVVFNMLTELYDVNDKTLYEAINEYKENVDNLTEKEKLLLGCAKKLDFEAELVSLISEYFVYLHQMPSLKE